MCGIVGFNWDDKVLVKKMADELTHRGPDDGGIYTDRHFSLGHRRLTIIDLSQNGHQPMFNEDKTVAVIFNGEIYNFKKIREILVKKGHVFLSNSDTEVIVHGYEDFGEKIFSMLDGKFAIAIWDIKKKKAIIARDRLGVKPLYYYIKGNKFIFASEIKSILLDETVERKINMQCLADYLSLKFSPGEETMFAGIKKLLPGNYMIYENQKISFHKYWQLPEFSTSSIPDPNTFDELMESSIRKRMMSDVPIGVFLSGGLDSSTIVAYLSRMTDNIRTFAIGFNDPTDEFKYASLVAEKFNTQHEEVVSNQDILSFLPKIVWHMDDPMADPASLPTYILSEYVSKDVKVVLAGEGGDEVFGGYQVLNYLNPLKKVLAIPYFVRKNIFSPIALLASDLFKYPNKQILKLGSEMLAEDDLIKAYRKMFYVPFEEKEKRDILPEEYKDKLKLTTVLYENLNKYPDPRTGAYSYFFKEELPNDLLLKADKMGMAHGLEIRVPFLGYKLVEYSCGLDNKYKQNRYLFRKVVSKMLPRKIMNRKKQGFTMPISNWFPQKDFFARIEPHLEDLSKRKIFDDSFYRKIITNPQGFRNDHRIWTLLNFEMWNKVYLDKISPKKISI